MYVCLCLCVVFPQKQLTEFLKLRCCEQFEQFEIDRLDFTRKMMWLHTNVMSVAYVFDDQVSVRSTCNIHNANTIAEYMP